MELRSTAALLSAIFRHCRGKFKSDVPFILTSLIIRARVLILPTPTKPHPLQVGREDVAFVEAKHRTAPCCALTRRDESEPDVIITVAMWSFANVVVVNTVLIVE